MKTRGEQMKDSQAMIPANKSPEDNNEYYIDIGIFYITCYLDT